MNNMMQEMTEGEFGPASLDLETRVITDAILGIGTVSTEGTWTGERRDKPTESSFVAAFNFWAIDEFKTALSEDGYPIDRVDVQVNGNLLVLPSAEQRPGQQQPLNNPSEAKSGEALVLVTKMIETKTCSWSPICFWLLLVSLSWSLQFAVVWIYPTRMWLRKK